MPSPRGAFKAETQVHLLETRPVGPLPVGVCPRCAVLGFVCLVLWSYSSFATSLPELQTEYSSSGWEIRETDKQGKEKSRQPSLRRSESSLPSFQGLFPASGLFPSLGIESHWLVVSAPLILSLAHVKILDEEEASSI